MNMTGTPPRDDDTDDKKTETLEPSALLDEDGKIDISKVKSRANMSNHTHAEITDAVCHDMRRMAGRDDVTETAPIAEAFDISRTTVRRHLRGDCNCTPVADPETSPMENGISVATCDRIREVALRDDVRSAVDIASHFDLSRDTVRHHITDRCTHESTGPVFEFRDARWQVVVDSETDSETDTDGGGSA
jgi:response regulator of citrate/malate metabolism